MAGQALAGCERVRLVSHNDADGVTAAGILCNALYRQGVSFQVSIVSSFSDETLELLKGSDAVVLCDMGSGQPDLVRQIKGETLILDHHIPAGELSEARVHVNPHLAGIDGGYQLSASGVAYLVAREMGENFDLAGLALAGALGDKQKMEGGNRFILEEARKRGVVEVKHGLRLGEGDIAGYLEQRTTPYLPFTGDPAGIQRFLDEVGVEGDLSSLDEDGLRRLASAMFLKLLPRSDIDAVEELVGEVYYSSFEVLPNLFELMAVLNALGKMEEGGLALALCMRDKSRLEEALARVEEYQKRVVSALREAESQVVEKNNFRYVMLQDSDATGAIAGVLSRYRYPDLPFLALNEKGGVLRVSARATRRLVEEGLNLAEALRQAALEVGGRGGGHNIASGASIPPDRGEVFLDAVDRIIGEQLQKDLTKPS